MVNKAAAKLRAQLTEEGKVIVCPGVQDGLSARVCLAEGFETLYMVSHPSENQTADTNTMTHLSNTKLTSTAPRQAQAPP